MELNLDIGEGHYQIRGYGADYIQINHEKIDHSVIVAPDQLIYTWPPQSLAELNSSHFEPILNLHPAIVLLGTGKKLSFPNPALLSEFYLHRIGIEIMDTAAACRTYTVLMAEGRRVVAALFIKA